MKKIAVVLLNLGGPDRPEAVRPFLYNLFRDPAIIRLPSPFRQMLAWWIAKRREKIAQEIYAKIGGRSPILENTQAQARALEQKLSGDGDVKCFVAMRYWHPFTEGAAHAVRDFAPDEIILLPLYPQFSTTSTGSSLNAWDCAAHKFKITTPVKRICCYPEEPGFIRTMAQSIRVAYADAAKHGKPRLLLSAHGLPERIVKAGDPYQSQCERTAAALMRELAAENIENPDAVLCYQSRVGRLKWIGPAADDEIRRAGHDGVPVVMAPIAFVSEHSETLVEIEIEYRTLAAQSGVPYFARVPAVGTAPEFIDGLAGLVRRALSDMRSCISEQGGRICPPELCGCGQAVRRS